MTVGELARVSGQSRHAVARWIRDGVLPARLHQPEVSGVAAGRPFWWVDTADWEAARERCLARKRGRPRTAQPSLCGCGKAPVQRTKYGFGRVVYALACPVCRVTPAVWADSERDAVEQWKQTRRVASCAQETPDDLGA